MARIKKVTVHSGGIHLAEVSLELTYREGGYQERHLQRIARVLLDAEDRELYCHVQGRVCDVGLLVTETHGSDKACAKSSACLGARQV